MVYDYRSTRDAAIRQREVMCGDETIFTPTFKWWLINRWKNTGCAAERNALVNNERRNHKDADHEIEGDANQRGAQIIARHLCGWISGHGAPVEQFLPDAHLIIKDLTAAGLEFTDK